MHQTFYIDISEEITSIVDRLRKSHAKEVIIVVPKRAILIQSIVNLKLLKKEADNLRKNLILVTQDKLGKMLIEKAGISVEQRLENIEGQEIFEDKGKSFDNPKKIDEIPDMDGRGKALKKRFDDIGSEEYYQPENLDVIAEKMLHEDENIPAEAERITNKELVIDMGEELRKQKSSFQKNIFRKVSAPMDMVKNVEIKENQILMDEEFPIDGDVPVAKKISKKEFSQKKVRSFIDGGISEEDKGEKVGRFFAKSKKEPSDEYRSVNVEKKSFKYLIGFGLLLVLAISSLGAYLYVPKASIVVFPKSVVQSIDSQFEAKTTIGDVDEEAGLVPASIISVSDEITREYGVTGSKDSSDQKAHGTITIYNEFSPSPQPLVASTRFESPDGKIFRLTSSITVPGTEKVGTENKPGAIEAKVVADESGEKYNIEASSFTIPGFKNSGGEKYSKIYGKSFKPMTGGGGESQSVKTLSDADIDAAKTKVMKEMEVVVRQKLKDLAGGEQVMLDEAVDLGESTYTLSHSSGDATEKFSITVKTTASAMVFRTEDMKRVIARALAKKEDGGMSINSNSIEAEFGKADVDLKNGSMVVRAHGLGDIVPKIDLEEIKRNILGKDESEVKEYVNSYQNINNLEISYWPSFIAGKIPSYSNRVDISLDPSLSLE